MLTATICGMAAALMLGGCNNSGCTDNQSALPLMGFYDYSTGQTIQLDSIDFGGVGVPGDSLLVHAGQRRNQVYLPFRESASPTKFYIHYDYKEQGLDSPRLNDTLTFHYTAAPYFASSECGAMYTYTITSVEYTRHLIESVVVSDSVITNIERERIQVYFRTAQINPPASDDEDTPAEDELPEDNATGDGSGDDAPEEIQEGGER